MPMYYVSEVEEEMPLPGPYCLHYRIRVLIVWISATS